MAKGQSSAPSSKAGSRRRGKRAAASAVRDTDPLSKLVSDNYWTQSMQPLHVLMFLLPIIVLYEIGSALYLTDIYAGTRETIRAQKLLDDFFGMFGVAGLFMPGIALASVLLVWHFIARNNWKIRWNTVAGMGAESLAWTLPLIILAAMMIRFGSGALVAQGAPISPSTLSWQANLTISLGAGIYEEMLFRLIGIALIHFVLRDLLGAREWASSVVSVVGAAVAFALYHDVSTLYGGTNWLRFVFLTLAGIYLGTVYVMRGFGIVVGTHALYDAAVLVMLPGGINSN